MGDFQSKETNAEGGMCTPLDQFSVAGTTAGPFPSNELNTLVIGQHQSSANEELLGNNLLAQATGILIGLGSGTVKMTVNGVHSLYELVGALKELDDRTLGGDDLSTEHLDKVKGSLKALGHAVRHLPTTVSKVDDDLNLEYDSERSNIKKGMLMGEFAVEAGTLVAGGISATNSLSSKLGKMYSVRKATKSSAKASVTSPIEKPASKIEAPPQEAAKASPVSQIAAMPEKGVGISGQVLERHDFGLEGIELVKSGHFQEAIPKLQKAISNPTLYSPSGMAMVDKLRLNLGRAYMEIGDVAKAEENFNKAYRLNHINIEALRGRGIARVAQGSADKAALGEADLAEARLLNPGKARYFLEAAWNAFGLDTADHLVTAEELFTKAIDDNAGILGYEGRARVRAEMGKTNPAKLAESQADQDKAAELRGQASKQSLPSGGETESVPVSSQAAKRYLIDVSQDPLAKIPSKVIKHADNYSISVAADPVYQIGEQGLAWAKVKYNQMAAETGKAERMIIAGEKTGTHYVAIGEYGKVEPELPEPGHMVLHNHAPTIIQDTPKGPTWVTPFPNRFPSIPDVIELLKESQRNGWAPISTEIEVTLAKGIDYIQLKIHPKIGSFGGEASCPLGKGPPVWFEFNDFGNLASQVARAIRVESKSQGIVLGDTEIDELHTITSKGIDQESMALQTKALLLERPQ